MSARFWLFSLASAGAALMSGLGLGLYATTSPRVALQDAPMSLSTTQDNWTDPYPADLNGPAEVRCSGCGPTLAQRQMAAMTGGWNGYDDPVVRDYQAQTKDDPEDLMPAGQDGPPPPPVRRLPANIERFAAGEMEPSPQPVQYAQGSGGADVDAAQVGGSY